MFGGFAVFYWWRFCKAPCHVKFRQIEGNGRKLPYMPHWATQYFHRLKFLTVWLKECIEPAAWLSGPLRGGRGWGPQQLVSPRGGEGRGSTVYNRNPKLRLSLGFHSLQSWQRVLSCHGSDDAAELFWLYRGGGSTRVRLIPTSAKTLLYIRLWNMYMT